MAITWRTASLDNREVALIDLFPVIAEKNVDFDIKLNMDNKTGNNISHTTGITKGGQKMFIESLHTQDGNLKK